jgi:hypothetical protein
MYQKKRGALGRRSPSIRSSFYTEETEDILKEIIDFRRGYKLDATRIEAARDLIKKHEDEFRDLIKSTESFPYMLDETKKNMKTLRQTISDFCVPIYICRYRLRFYLGMKPAS